jgi:hypothetical protein
MSRATTLPSPWIELAERMGGVEALAEACGVVQSTLWRWARGKRPGAVVQRHVNALARRRGLPLPFAEAA